MGHGVFTTMGETDECLCVDEFKVCLNGWKDVQMDIYGKFGQMDVDGKDTSCWCMYVYV
jgi:hypothetical protein